jgi:ABC-type glutathione transport system ATPase component
VNILDLILRLQERMGTAVVLITHDPLKGLLCAVSGNVYAVDGVSFCIAPGQTLGLVGESGCGKLTVARAVIRPIEPNSAEVRILGCDILLLKNPRCARAAARRRSFFRIRSHR